MSKFIKTGSRQYKTPEQIMFDAAEGEVRDEIAQIRAETAAQNAETGRGLAILAIFRKGYQVGGVTKFLSNNAANGQLLESIFDGDINGWELSPEWFADVLKQNPKTASQFAWEKPTPSKHEQQLLEEQDRKTFAVVCRSNDVAEIEANFRLLREVLGSGFSEYAATQAIRSNAISLSPATAEELTTWDQENVKAHNQWLLTSDVRTLKKIVANEAQANRDRDAQADAKRVLDIKRQFQDGRFEPLPSQWKGEVLDANFIKQATPQLIRLLREHYGSYQLDLRLRGETA